MIPFNKHFTFWHRDMRDVQPDAYIKPRGAIGGWGVFVAAETVTREYLAINRHRSFYVCGDVSELVGRLRRDASGPPLTIDGTLSDGRAARVTFDGSNSDHCFLWPVSVLFGEERQHVTPDAALSALSIVGIALRDATLDAHDKWVRLRATPALTGLDLMNTYLPRGVQFARLEGDIEAAILSRIQSRREVFKASRKSGSELFYYDHRRFYPSILSYADFPIGELSHTLTSTFANDYAPSWYRLTARVPADWRHIGLVPFKGTWPCKPGTAIHGWYPEPEARLLHQHGWLETVSERIAPEYASRCFRPFVDKAREIENACNGNELAVAWCRIMLLGAIGRLHPSASRAREQFIPLDQFSEKKYAGKNFAYRKDEFGTVWAVIHNDGRSQDTRIAPQVTAHVWAQGRVRLTNAMLSIPRDNLIGCNLDAIYSTAAIDFDYFTERGRSVPFVMKGHLATGFPYPKEHGELMALSAQAERHHRVSGMLHDGA